MAVFQERLRTTKDFAIDRSTDITTSGTLSDVATANFSYVRFTLATTVNSLADGASGKILIINNANTVNLTVTNNSGGSVANRILTGTGADATLAAGASMMLIYDDTATKWRVTGTSFDASVTAGFAVSDQITLTAGATITPGSTAFQAFRVQGNSGAITLSTTPFTSSAPGFGSGAVITLIGNSNTNTVTLAYTDSAKGFVGKTSVTLGKYDTVTLQYNASLDRWTEMCRNIVNFSEQFAVGAVGNTSTRLPLPLGATIYTDGARVPTVYNSTACVRTSATTTSFQGPAPYTTVTYRSGMGSFSWSDGVNAYNAGFFINSNAASGAYYIALVNGSGVTGLSVANNGGTIQINVTHSSEGATNRFGFCSFWISDS